MYSKSGSSKPRTLVFHRQIQKQNKFPFGQQKFRNHRQGQKIDNKFESELAPQSKFQHKYLYKLFTL